MIEEFHNVDTPASTRESFNNTIILLTMVKREYYYIIGFSRPKGHIEIGFDYKSDVSNVITESIVVDFYTDNKKIIVSSEIKNINPDSFTNMVGFDDKFYFENQVLKYRLIVQRDEIIPVSIEKMNTIILRAKSEIFGFLAQYSKNCINKNII